MHLSRALRDLQDAAMFHAPRGSSMAQKRRSREQWWELVRGWPGSGLTQAQYCERHGISPGSLYRWRDVFRRERDAGGGWPRAGIEEPVRLLPVQFSEPVEPPRRDRVLTVVFGDGVRLEVLPGFDAATLARLVEVLQELAAA
jgi:transposase-like protein